MVVETVEIETLKALVDDPRGRAREVIRGPPGHNLGKPHTAGNPRAPRRQVIMTSIHINSSTTYYKTKQNI